MVSGYWRRARIPFEQIERVSAPHWERLGFVVIRFRTKTAFGRSIYYLPKWAPARRLTELLERELRDIVWPKRSAAASGATQARPGS